MAKPSKPFASARIPQALDDAINQHVKETGETRSSTIINALVSYLNFKLDDRQSNSAGSRLDRLEQRVALLEKERQPRQLSISDNTSISSDNTSQQNQSDNNRKQSDNTGDSGTWMRSGQAFEEAKKRGYKKSKNTFQKKVEQSLREESLHQDLATLGLVADFKVKKQANPKNTTIKWLRFES